MFHGGLLRWAGLALGGSEGCFDGVLGGVQSVGERGWRLFLVIPEETQGW